MAGDERYGDRTFNARLRSEHRLVRLFLHASTLRFEHPAGGRIEVSAPLPADLVDVLQGLGLETPAA